MALASFGKWLTFYAILPSTNRNPCPTSTAFSKPTRRLSALEIAAAGGHNVLFIGSPGAGKTMLARAFPGILPPLSRQESRDARKLYFVAGLLSDDRFLVTDRPFRSPHHSASQASLIGGGRIPRPGEVSLAHHGVLFMDELPEYRREVLEGLRQPLEDGEVTVSRVSAQVTYPCEFILLATINVATTYLIQSNDRCNKKTA